MANKISTGSFDLTRWLYGGYECDVITMLAGPPGSGKTNLVILVACSQARKGNKILFIDTEGGFSVERVKQIVGEEHEKILENILLIGPVNFEEQKKHFTKILNKINKEQIGLIIVDGMAMLYRLELGDAQKSGKSENIKKVNREIAKQMQVLAEIARKKRIPVIITNQVYGAFQSEEDWRRGKEKEMNIVGGDLMKYWSKCIIELKNNRGKRKACLLKHRSLKEKELNFEITNKGVRKKGWI
ncbi:DNA repair and recombination protein RadB [Candidatus Pacearchaeota archaeon]|jgi:DNA repair protein RadB|nr:DNA repair and recombination protein RadB [Candidatus Pacearchaeota archaeon]|tara:strand:+ start:48 stop:776 length:729 start_codon:yes stop_codon:yes gene_type:complete